MAKTVVLIDTENIGGEWAQILGKLSKADEIYLFYTVNSRNISVEDLQTIILYPDKIKFVLCEVGGSGRNALDFQLVSYLGFMLRNASKTRYVIYSNDTGYNPVVEFWRARGRSVERMGKELLPEYREEEVSIEIEHCISDKELIPLASEMKSEASVLTKSEKRKAKQMLIIKALGRKAIGAEASRIGTIMSKAKKEGIENLSLLCNKHFGDKGKQYLNALAPVAEKYLELI